MLLRKRPGGNARKYTHTTAAVKDHLCVVTKTEIRTSALSIVKAPVSGLITNDGSLPPSRNVSPRPRVFWRRPNQNFREIDGEGPNPLYLGNVAAFWASIVGLRFLAERSSADGRGFSHRSSGASRRETLDGFLAPRHHSEQNEGQATRWTIRFARKLGVAMSVSGPADSFLCAETRGDARSFGIDLWPAVHFGLAGHGCRPITALR
jgi:hypothetical protein